MSFKRVQFLVKGKCLFPIERLAKDYCYPSDEASAKEIARNLGERGVGHYTIRLTSMSLIGPMLPSWELAGWTVLKDPENPNSLRFESDEAEMDKARANSVVPMNVTANNDDGKMVLRNPQLFNGNRFITKDGREGTINGRILKTKAKVDWLVHNPTDWEVKIKDIKYLHTSQGWTECLWD